MAEDRARAGGLGSLAKSVTRQLIAPRDLRASLVSWINFVFLPEAVNRSEAPEYFSEICASSSESDCRGHSACCLAPCAGALQIVLQKSEAQLRVRLYSTCSGGTNSQMPLRHL